MGIYSGKKGMTALLLTSEISAALNTLADTAGVKSRLLEIIEQASATLENLCYRRFDEYVATVYVSSMSISQGGDRVGQTIYLPADLRAIITLMDGTNNTYTSDTYILQPRNADSNYVIAYRTITLKSPASWGVARDQTSPSYADISIHGTWGYGGEWVATGATLGANLDNSSTSFSASSGALLEVGMNLKIDSEYLTVTGINTNTITCNREVNGSVLAAHNSGSVIYRWRALPIVRQLVERLIAWRIQQTQAPLVGQAVIGDVVFPVSTDGLPRDVIAIIQNTGLQRVRRVLG